MTVEFRNAASEVRAVDGRTIRGYAAVFDTLSLDLGGFRERIERGAFAESLRQRDTLLLRNHNSDHPMARSSSGTLEIREDRRGLAFTATLPNTAEARSVAVTIERGDVNGMSFGFVVVGPDDESFDHEGRQIVRTIKRVTLLEISTTPFPAYPDTTVSGDAAPAGRQQSGARRRLKAKRRHFERLAR